MYVLVHVHACIARIAACMGLYVPCMHVKYVYDVQIEEANRPAQPYIRAPVYDLNQL
jgi:hypothetical protein